MLRVAYRITYSKGTIPLRICYCITEVLYDRSFHVKASVRWRHVWLDISGSLLGFVRNVSHKPFKCCGCKRCIVHTELDWGTSTKCRRLIHVTRYQYKFCTLPVVEHANVTQKWRTKSGRKVHGTNFAVENYRVHIFYCAEGWISYNCADTVQFRICYCLTEVLFDRSNHVKASVLWRHG